MKRALICFTLISIALLSCKKDHHNSTTEPTGKLYPVSFNISSFTQSTDNPFDQNSKTKVNAVDPSASTITQILYKLYDANKVLKKTVYIKKGALNFGTFTDSIPSGNYTAVFVGITLAQTEFANFIDNNPSIPTPTPTFRYLMTNNFPFPETFYANAALTVGDTPLQQSIVLKRLNSEVFINIKDAIPPNAHSILLQISNMHTTCTYLDAKSSFAATAGITAILKSTDIGTTNYQIGMKNVFNNTSTVTALIQVQDAAGVIITQKYIYNITLQANTRTILTGNVFSNNGNAGGIAVTFNPGYNTTDINQSF